MTPIEIAELTEDGARALFRSYRFAGTGGEPCCNKCGSLAVYEYRSRPIFKCKACELQFSLTSNTAFAYRKLSYKFILIILAEFNIAYQGRSALEIRRNLRKIRNYKTIFVWLHKVRCALQTAEQNRLLAGEVEIDGKEVGGYIRPKNMRGPGDHWKVPYRAAERKLMITLARERGGGARAWVAKAEHHPIPQIMDAVSPDADAFVDGGHWGKLRDHCRLHRIYHNQAFYTPDACTNFAEAGFRTLAGMEQIHRHVIGNYLDLYAAQLAWRLTNVGRTDEVGFSSLMDAMLAPGRSPMAGYFLPRRKGGVRRRCQIVLEDGTRGEWSPPDVAERRRARRAERVARNETPMPRVADARSVRWKDGFTYVSAEKFLSDPKAVPGSPGVYALFLRSGERLLSLAGYFPDSILPPWDHEGCRNLYIGQSRGIRERVMEHLQGDIRGSSLRETVAAIHWLAGTSNVHLGDLRGRAETERALSQWLKSEVIVGYKTCGYASIVEKEMLLRTPSPLNIADRPPTPFSGLLTNCRERFREAVVAYWEPAPPRPRNFGRR